MSNVKRTITVNMNTNKGNEKMSEAEVSNEYIGDANDYVTMAMAMLLLRMCT